MGTEKREIDTKKTELYVDILTFFNLLLLCWCHPRSSSGIPSFGYTDDNNRTYTPFDPYPGPPEILQNQKHLGNLYLPSYRSSLTTSQHSENSQTVMDVTVSPDVNSQITVQTRTISSNSPPSYRSMEDSYHIEFSDSWQPSTPIAQ